MSRYFKVVYDDFIDFGDELERNHSYWKERVEALASLFEKFLPDSFQGETADSINLYFNEVHGYILAGLYELMEISKRNFLMYKNDYYELIDASLHAVISEYELEHIADTMKRYKLELEDYHYELKQILNSVSDIVRIKEPSAEDLYDDYEAVIKYVEKLRDDILDLEAKHKREDFVEFNEVKSRLTSFMEEVFSKGRSFKENYQTKAVSGLDSFADYNTALMAAESYIESTQERYEKALAAEAIRIEKLKAEQRIVDGLKQTAWALVDVAAIGLAIMSGGTLAPISVAILTFSAAEITEGAGNIYLGITGDGSSIAFNPIRDTLFMGNQDVYNVASLAVNIADMKLSKPKVSSLDDIARFGAKSVEAKGINRVKDLTKKLLGKVDDVGDVKKGGKGVSAVDEAVEAVGKGSKKTVCKSGTSTLAQYGDDFGKVGTYVENPNIKVDWTQYAEHAAERMQQRGMTQEIVNNIVENGKVLSQNNGNKFAYITQEGVAIVSKEGKLITAWSSADFDSSMLEIISKLFGE